MDLLLLQLPLHLRHQLELLQKAVRQQQTELLGQSDPASNSRQSEKGSSDSRRQLLVR